MQGKGASLSIMGVVLAHVVCKPRVLAASLIPNKDTPSVVAKQSFDRESKEYPLPKYLHTICKQAIPHCMESY